MIANVDNVSVGGGWKDLKDVGHDVADAFEMKITHAGPRRQESVKWGTCDDELFSRTVAWEFMESPSKHAAKAWKEAGMNMRRPMSSSHVVDTMT